MIFLFGIFESLWRRAFGSGNYNRVILHIINVLATSLYLWHKDTPLIKVVLAVPVFEFFYWSVGHGAAFDIGRAGKPDSEMIKRYEKYFWDKWCKFIVPESCWYGFWYDYLWMMFRYGLPAILIFIILGKGFFWLAGFGVATAYAIFWNLSDESRLKRLSATEWAEIVSGFVSGFLLTLFI